MFVYNMSAFFSRSAANKNVCICALIINNYSAPMKTNAKLKAKTNVCGLVTHNFQ